MCRCGKGVAKEEIKVGIKETIMKYTTFDVRISSYCLSRCGKSGEQSQD